MYESSFVVVTKVTQLFILDFHTTGSDVSSASIFMEAVNIPKINNRGIKFYIEEKEKNGYLSLSLALDLSGDKVIYFYLCY